MRLSIASAEGMQCKMNNEVATIRKKILLKRQALQLIRVEIEELRERLNLIEIKERLEGQIESTDDSIVGRKLDCINFLLEN